MGEVWGDVIDEEFEKAGIDILAEQDDEPTADELRALLGEKADEYSDEDLVKMYEAEEVTDEVVEAAMAEKASGAASAEANLSEVKKEAEAAMAGASPNLKFHLQTISVSSNYHWHRPRND